MKRVYVTHMSAIIKLTNVTKYNQHKRPRDFQVGDLLLIRADVGGKNVDDGNLAAN